MLRENLENIKFEQFSFRVDVIYVAQTTLAKHCRAGLKDK